MIVAERVERNVLYVMDLATSTKETHQVIMKHERAIFATDVAIKNVIPVTVQEMDDFLKI